LLYINAPATVTRQSVSIPCPEPWLAGEIAARDDALVRRERRYIDGVAAAITTRMV